MNFVGFGRVFVIDVLFVGVIAAFVAGALLRANSDWIAVASSPRVPADANQLTQMRIIP